LWNAGHSIGLSKLSWRNYAIYGGTKIIIAGDALIGKVPSQINMLPSDKHNDITKAKVGLKELLKHEVETLLVGDGESILKEAKEVVVKFLAS